MYKHIIKQLLIYTYGGGGDMYKHIIKQLLIYTYGGGGGATNFVYVPVKKPKYAYTKINKNTHGILILLGVETKP